MKVVKFQQKNTYKGRDGKDRHYYGYALVLDNGTQVGIKCYSANDYSKLDAVSEYVTSNK